MSIVKQLKDLSDAYCIDIIGMNERFRIKLNFIVTTYIESLNDEFPKKHFQYFETMGTSYVNIYSKITGKKIFEIESNGRYISISPHKKFRSNTIIGISDFLCGLTSIMSDSNYDVFPNATRKIDLVTDRVKIVRDGNNFKIKNHETS